VPSAAAQELDTATPPHGKAPQEADPLRALGMVVGAVYDSTTGQVHLIGDGEHTESSPTGQQIAVALRWAVADKPDGFFVSIDPWPGNPESDWMKVAISDAAQDTDFGWVMFEADRMLKSYSLGADSVTRIPLRSSIPGFQNMVDLGFQFLTNGRRSEVWSRFWFYPRSTPAESSASMTRLGNVAVGVRTETMRRKGNQLVSGGGAQDPVAEKFAQFVTEHYADLADEEPVFRQLEQQLRLLLVSEWIRTNHIRVDLDWVAREIDDTFRIPRVTPALRVSEQRTETTATAVHVETRRLFGGVDFQNVKVTPDKVKNDAADWASRASEIGRASASDGFSYSFNGHEYHGARLALGRRRRPGRPVETLLRVALPGGGVLNLQAETIPRPGAELHGRSDRVVALPVLHSVNPTGRDGSTQTMGIKGKPESDVPVRHYELYDVDGSLIARFEKHDIEQATARIVVLASDSGSPWRLYPKAKSVLWASGPDDRRLAFDPDLGKLVGQQIGPDLLRYEYNSHGVLERITVGADAPGTVLVEFEQGSNGNQTLLARAKDGKEVRLTDAAAGGAELKLRAYNEAGQEYPLTIEPATANWHSPGTAQGLDYLDRHAPAIARAVALAAASGRPRLVPDGGFTLFVTGSEVRPIASPLSSTDVVAKIRHKVPEESTILGVEQTPDGRTAVLYWNRGNYELEYVRRDGSATQFAGSEARRQFEGIERTRVIAASTNEVQFVYVSAEDDTVMLQLGPTQHTLPIAELRRLTENPESPEGSAEGRALDSLFAQGPRRDLVVYRGASYRRPQDPNAKPGQRELADPVEIAEILTARYGGRGLHVYLDDETQRARANRKALEPIKGPADIVALISENEYFNAIDRPLVENIKTILQGSGVRTSAQLSELGDIPNVLVISGDNTQQLVAHLHNLGKQGVLHNKVLLLNTCYTDSNANLFHDLVTKYGTKAILHHGEQITVVALQAVMHAAAELLTEIKEHSSSIHPADFLRQAADRALRNAGQDALRREIRKLRKGVLQISTLEQMGVTVRG
jgi:hypothetical protein